MKRTLGLVALAGAVALLAGMGAVVVVARTSPDRVPDGLRRLGDTGIAVPVPKGWVDHHRARSGRLLLEVEDRPIAGLLPTRGMWVHRWQGADPTTAPGWTDGPTVAGFASVVHEEVIGGPLVRRLPTVVTLHRRIFRTVAYGRVYEVGFWGPDGTLDDDVERTVLARLRIDEPPPIELAHDGVSVTLPSTWDRGDCEEGGCAFSPSAGDRGSDSWVYVFGSKAESLEGGAQRLLFDLAPQGPTSLSRDAVEIDGRAAVRIRFGLAPKDTGFAQFEELLVPSDHGFALVAAGWRTPEGRAELDSVLQTIRL